MPRALDLAFLQGFQLIQPPNKQQVGELLQHLQWVGDAAAPEGIPDSVDLVAQLAGEHRGRCGARGDGGLGGWGAGPVATAAGPATAGCGGVSSWGCQAWGLQTATGALHPLGRSHRHHQALDFLERLVVDRFTGLLLKGNPDLIIGDPAAVLRDQGDQGIGEFGEVGHQSGQWVGGGSGNPTQTLL